MKRAIPLPLATAALATALLAAAVAGALAVRTSERTTCQEPSHVDRQYCTSCHTDTATLQAMKDKRGF